MLDIAFAKAVAPKSGVVVVPLAEGAALTGQAAALDKALAGALKRAIAAADFTGKKDQQASLLAPKAGLKQVLLIGTGSAEAFAARGAEMLGGAIAAALSKRKPKPRCWPRRWTPRRQRNWPWARGCGPIRFDKYRTTQKEDGENAEKLTKLTVMPADAAAAARRRLCATGGGGLRHGNDPRTGHRAGQYFVSPRNFADRTAALKKLGVKVEVFDRKDLEKLGFGSLLSVSQGGEASREPRMVAMMQWLGASGDGVDADGKKIKKPKDPVVFVLARG